VLQAGAGVAFLQFGQVEAGAEVVARAVEHGRHAPYGQRPRRLLRTACTSPSEKGIALAGRSEGHDGDVAVDLELDVFCGAGPWVLVCGVGGLFV
jgi:hypothetical protein